MKKSISLFWTTARVLVTRVVCGGAVIGLASSALGDLIAYDGFDYTVGSQSVGQSGIVSDWNGGTGWAGPWEDIAPDGGNAFVNPASSTIEAFSDIQAGSLSYTDVVGHVLVTAGNKLHNSGTNTSITLGTTATSRPARTLTSIQITNGTTTWISFLGMRTGLSNAAGLYERGANISLFNTNVWGTNNNGRVAIGESSGAPPAGQSNDTWGVVPIGLGSTRRQSALAFTNQALVVIRINHHDDNDPITFTNDPAVNADDLYFFLNPTNLAVEPSFNQAVTNILSTETNAGGNLTGIDMAFNRFVLFAGNIGQVTNPAAEWLIDEIRVGTTYADVVPYTGGPAPPIIINGIFPLVGGGIDLSLIGAPSAVLTVESTITIAFSNWTSIGTVTLSGGGTGIFSDPRLVVTNQQRFYRARY